MKDSPKLVSHNERTGASNVKHAYSVEICPLCKNDLVLLPKKLAEQLRGISRLVLVTKVHATLSEERVLWAKQHLLTLTLTLTLAPLALTLTLTLTLLPLPFYRFTLTLLPFTLPLPLPFYPYPFTLILLPFTLHLPLP
jgi:hypothetical protein